MKIKRPLLLAGIGYGIIIAVTISLQIWALNKALILSDDGWFACLLRDHPKDISTQYHLLFGGVLRENILASRAFAYVLKILSIFVLSLGAVLFKASLQKNNAMNFKYIFWAFSFLFVGQMDLGQTSLNYASLTLFIIELSLGVSLIGLSRQNKVLIFIGGLLIGFIIPVKITASLIIPAQGILIALLSRKNNWKNALIFILGAIISFLMFLFIATTPQDYFSNFIRLATKTIELGENDYGIIFIINWLKKAFVFYFSMALLAYFLTSASVKINSMSTNRSLSKKWLYVLEIFIVIISILYLTWNGTFPVRGKTIQKPFILFWILVFSILFKNTKKDNDLIFLSIFLLLTPLLLSLGSDSAGYTKAQYVTFLTLAIGLNIKNKRQFVYFSLVACLCFYSLIQGQFLKRDWFGNKWLEQTEDVRTLGIKQNIKVDKRNYDMISRVIEITEPGEDVICDMFSWGFAFLAGLNPVSYSFRINTMEAETIVSSYSDDRKTLNIILENETESDYGSKQDLINILRTINGVTEYNIGYHRSLFRYSDSH